MEDKNFWVLISRWKVNSAKWPTTEAARKNAASANKRHIQNGFIREYKQKPYEERFVLIWIHCHFVSAANVQFDFPHKSVCWYAGSPLCSLKRTFQTFSVLWKINKNHPSGSYKAKAHSKVVFDGQNTFIARPRYHDEFTVWHTQFDSASTSKATKIYSTAVLFEWTLLICYNKSIIECFAIEHEAGTKGRAIFDLRKVLNYPKYGCCEKKFWEVL